MDQKPAYDPLPPSSPEKVASSPGGAASPPLTRNRQTLLLRRDPAPKVQSTRFVECAGSTTACAAVFCCCPCGLAYLLFVAAVKLPARVLRRALRRRKEKVKKGRMKTSVKKSGMFSVDDEDVYDDLSIHPGMLLPRVSSEDVLCLAKTSITADDFAELEKEMSTSFYGAGFWRSLSQVQRD